MTDGGVADLRRATTTASSSRVVTATVASPASAEERIAPIARSHRSTRPTAVVGMTTVAMVYASSRVGVPARITALDGPIVPTTTGASSNRAVLPMTIAAWVVIVRRTVVADGSDLVEEAPRASQSVRRHERTSRSVPRRRHHPIADAARWVGRVDRAAGA
jgi:hypothetical protein